MRQGVPPESAEEYLLRVRFGVRARHFETPLQNVVFNLHIKTRETKETKIPA